VDKALQRIGLRQQLNLFIPRLVYFLVIFFDREDGHRRTWLVAISNAIGAFFEYLSQHRRSALTPDPWQHGSASSQDRCNPIC